MIPREWRPPQPSAENSRFHCSSASRSITTNARYFIQGSFTPQRPEFLRIDAPTNMEEKLILTSTKFSCSRLSSTSRSQGKPAKSHRVKSRTNRRKEKGKSTFHCANIFCWHSIANSIPKTILQGLPFPRQKLTGFQIRKNTQHEKKYYS